VVGSLETLNLKVSVANDGDPAHNTHLVLTLPTSPNSIPMGCKEITNGSQDQVRIECEVANLLRNGAQQVFPFAIDAEKSAKGATSLKATAKVDSATQNQNVNSSFELLLPLSFEADVEIYGYLQPLNQFWHTSYYYSFYDIFRQAEQEIYSFGAVHKSETKNMDDKINTSVSIQV
jgi:Integrin alpha